MPVRIYEIAKRLGIESKDVLAKARELGIAAARIPSSSLDRITAEYLEEKLGGVIVPSSNAVPQTAPIIAKPAPVVVNGKDNTLVDPEQEIVIAKQTIVHIFLFENAVFRFIGSFPFNAQRPGAVAPAQFSAEVALVANREGRSLEFKASARWNFKAERENKEVVRSITKTIAAFMNTEGGDMIIGVGNNGKVIGLEADFKTLGNKQNTEGFEQFLNQTLSSALGVHVTSLFQITFHTVLNLTVAHIRVKKSPVPVYVKGGDDDVLFTRNGNLTEKVPTRQIVPYCEMHWPESSSDARWS